MGLTVFAVFNYSYLSEINKLVDVMDLAWSLIKTKLI